MPSASGRVALITGAGQGIGAAIAMRLATDGRIVALVDRDDEALATTIDAIRQAGGTAFGQCVDVADERAAIGAAEELSNLAGPPAILVSNAGFTRDKPLLDMSLGDRDDVQHVHLRASFLLARALVPGMKCAGWGRILQISSTSAMGHADRANYCAAKAGMHGFVRALATELGPMGITANAIAPGLIVTRMTEATAARRGMRR